MILIVIVCIVFIVCEYMNMLLKCIVCVLMFLTIFVCIAFVFYEYVFDCICICMPMNVLF